MGDVLDDAVSGKGLVPAFQRVVSLPDETTIGYEALARWPSLGNPPPVDVIVRAEETGRLEQFDHMCILEAAKAAAAGPAAPGMLLLVNSEPVTPYFDAPLRSELAAVASSFHLVFELTERNLLRQPRVLLQKVAAARSMGFAIALDDIGAQDESLSVLDIVQPDILKLDIGLIQKKPDLVQARTISAILAHHERTGATIIAEGIETSDHLEQAIAYGATLGQGFRYGYPGSMSIQPEPNGRPRKRPVSVDPVVPSTFHLVARGLEARTIRKRSLIELSRYIERLALHADVAPIVLTTVQSASNYRGATRRKYDKIAQRSPLVVIFGEDVPSAIGSRIRGVSLSPLDPLSMEWTIVVIGPDTAAALIAREKPGTEGRTHDENRLFDTVITFDRTRVALAARTLLSRIP